MNPPRIDLPKSRPAVDLETLLTPISADAPAGEALRYSGLYDAVEAARREDDPNLPQGVWQTALKRADWLEVERLCLEALETRGKDLQVAAWLLEAWTRTDGLTGTLRGLALVAGLCESFWESVHPQPRDGDLEYRLPPLHWLNEHGAAALQRVAVTRPESDEAPAYDSLDLMMARHLDKLGKANPKAAPAESEGKPTLDKFLVSVTLTPTPFYVALAAEARSALEGTDSLAALLDHLAGKEAPSLQRLGDALFALQHFAGRVLAERREAGEEITGPAGEDEDHYAFADEDGDGDEKEVPLYSGGPIRSRAEAYRRLSEAADYLLRTEPHSPAPYLVKRAVAWGSMTLTELLRELIRSDTDIRTVYDLLGIHDRS